MGQLDLQIAFTGVGMLRKNIQDQGSAVGYLDLIAKFQLELAQMARAELAVEDHNVGQQLFDHGLDFFDFSRADKGFRVGALQHLGGLTDHVDPGRVCQQLKLCQRIIQAQQVGLSVNFDAYQKGPRARSARGLRMFWH